METNDISGLGCFPQIADPRKSNRRHPLSDILFIACCAVISGAEGWDDIELYGKCKLEWLREFLELPHGIPSEDTFRRVFTLLNPEVFERAFRTWISGLVSSVCGDIIPIDGKRLRGAFRSGKTNALYQVSAWSCRHQVVLGQVKTDSKSNEITAIPKLLKLLDIKGAVVTMDAMGTQKSIAADIIHQGGDYLLALKGNHKTLRREVVEYFNYLEKDGRHEHRADSSETLDKGHGRLETRRCRVVSDIAWLEGRESWAGLKSVVEVRSTTEHLSAGRTGVETRYYISSLKRSAAEIQEMVRAHWQIENNLHWVLDVSFSEDASQIHTPNAAENFSLLRKIALTLLKKDTKKASLKGKRKVAGWDNDFMLSLLSLFGAESPK